MASLYWITGGTGNWGPVAGNWSLTSGGVSSGTIPTTTTDVFFDGNSGTGTSTHTGNVNVGSLTCTGYTGTLAINSTLQINGAYLGANGNFILGSGMTLTFGSPSFSIALRASGLTPTINTNGITISVGRITINTATANYSLAGNLNVTTSIQSANGGLITNGYNITTPLLSFAGNGQVEFDSTSVITVAQLSLGPSLSGFVPGNSTVVFSGSGLLTSSGYSLYNVTVNSGSSLYVNDSLTLTNNLVFNGAFTLEIGAAGAGVNLPAPANVTMSTSSGSIGTIISDTPGTQGIIVGNGGAYNFNWLNITDNAANNGTFNAHSSVNGGDVTGWNIFAPVAGGQGQLALIGVGS
jgi:hypothetical protein